MIEKNYSLNYYIRNFRVTFDTPYKLMMFKFGMRIERSIP